MAYWWTLLSSICWCVRVRCSLWTFSFLEWRTDWRIMCPPVFKETILYLKLAIPVARWWTLLLFKQMLFAVSLKDGLDFICASSVASWIPIWMAFARFRKEHGVDIMPHTMLVTFVQCAYCHRRWNYWVFSIIMSSSIWQMHTHGNGNMKKFGQFVEWRCL